MKPPKPSIWLPIALVTAFAAGVFSTNCYHRYDPKPRPTGTPTQAPTGEGWIDLLDTDHVAGWKNAVDDKDIFEIEPGMLHIYGKTVYPLRYVVYEPLEFGDFDLHIEFRLDNGANSGVFPRFHGPEPENRGFEVQILDDHRRKPSPTGTGAVYDAVSPMFNLARPAGEWNSYDISLRGAKLSVAVNGWEVIRTDFSQMTAPVGKHPDPYAEMPESGKLAIQDHGGQVWIRSIRIKHIESYPQDAVDK